MSELASAVCSVTPTKRRRYFWAAWWTGAPSYSPFRKPDASNGGADTLEEALAEAQRVAGRHLSVIESHWACAWKSVLRGETPTPPPPPRQRPTAERTRTKTSSWAVLGLAPGASLAEVKQAFRKRALETHPDQGGDPAQFRAAHAAYEKLFAKIARAPRAPKRK
jgi:hypothetical protein